MVLGKDRKEKGLSRRGHGSVDLRLSTTLTLHGARKSRGEFGNTASQTARKLATERVSGQCH